MRYRWLVALASALFLRPGMALAQPAAQETATRSFPGAQNGGDYYLDSKGNRIDFRRVYEGWFGEHRYPKNYGRAVGENLAFTAFEFFLYWYDPNSNAIDWQYPNIGDKLAAANNVVFDDNMQLTNFLLHPLAGGAHYGLTRLNGFGIPVSFGAAAASSTLYETVLEYREVVSINDLIVTPFAGMAVGEMLFQLGNYLNSESHRGKPLEEITGAGQFGRKIASLTLGIPRRSHDIIDLPPPPPEVTDDSLGLSSAYWHEFRLGAGAEFARNDHGEGGQYFSIREQTTLIAMPGFLRPGDITTWYSNGNFTATDTKVAFDRELRDVDVLVDAHLFGHFEQHVTMDSKGKHGIAHEVAGHTGIRYVERWLMDRHDFYATLHLMGPVGTVWIPMGSTTLRFALDAAPDFAAIRSLAYEKWVARFGTEGTKSSLLMHGYYNAWGVSTGASAAATTKLLTMSLAGRFGHYESIDGIERFHHKVTREPHNLDDVLEVKGTIAFEPRGTALSIRLEGEHIARTSKMAPFSNPRYDQTLGITLGAAF